MKRTTGRPSARDKYLKKHYGISEVEYKLLANQFDGTCWICRTPPKPGKNLAVDHDHKLAKAEKNVRYSVRGVLCFQCNKKLIGRRRREHAQLYLNAHAYLTEGRAQRLLGH